jgi:glycosyltransferase involved in cell wall biosynthesis
MRGTIKRICPAAEITGWLAPGEVRARLAKARALVFPSLGYESYGLVVAEAASLGIPTIASDTVLVSGQICETDSGLVFASGNWQDLACRLSEAQDSKIIARLSAAAYAAHARAPPSIDAACQALLEVCEDILSSPRMASRAKNRERRLA